MKLARSGDLRNTIVLITGASSGIGRACAGVFAAASARLILVGRRGGRLGPWRWH